MQDGIEPGESRRNFLIKSGMLIGVTSLLGPACFAPPRLSATNPISGDRLSPFTWAWPIRSRPE